MLTKFILFGLSLKFVCGKSIDPSLRKNKQTKKDEWSRPVIGSFLFYILSHTLRSVDKVVMIWILLNWNQKTLSRMNWPLKSSLLFIWLMTLAAMAVSICLLMLLKKNENCNIYFVFQVMLQMLYLPAAWWRRAWDWTDWTGACLSLGLQPHLS